MSPSANPSDPAHGPSGPEADAPGRWLGGTPSLDLKDTRLRLKARSLTQLCKTDREKALALYAFVKRMPFCMPLKLQPHSARQVLDLQRGDTYDKAILLVALLRAVRIPARLRFVAYAGEVLRGLLPRTVSTAATRPVLEAWLGGRWVATDTYIFDALYMAAARQRLQDLGWELGYGMHRDGQALWNGVDDAWSMGRPPADDPLVLADHGCHHGPREFEASESFRREHRQLTRRMQWNVLAPVMDRAIRDLRERSGAGAPAAERRA